MDTTPTKPWSEMRGLSSTEEEIVRAVNELRFVTVDEILRLLFKKGSRTYARKLLRTLAGGQDGKMNEYLFRFRLPAAGGNYLRIYTLGRAGARFLRQSNVPVSFFYRPHSVSFYSYGYLMHQLSLTKFLVALRVFVRDHKSYHLAETLNSIDMSSEESYTHVQALPSLTHEQRSANARKAQVTKRAHGIALGPTPRLNAAQTQALLADRAQGMTTVTLAAKYGESRRFVWHVLQRLGDPLPPVSRTYSHLSPEQIQALVGDRAAGMTHQRLAAAYGVSKDYVATVLKREGDPTRQPSTQCSLPCRP